MEDNIIVSVSCITYNHAKYIRQCLDGMLMQKTDFRYEILIHDDASTDGTDDIIREYETKYPDIIKPIYETENQYSKGIRISATYNYPRAKGKYIALCEGDDYWIDSYKLQKQVDFLDNHLDFSMCFTGTKVKCEVNNITSNLYEDLKTQEYWGDDIISKWIVPTCSVVFKKDILHYIPNDIRFCVGDNVCFLTCAKHGRIFCISEPTSVYRRQSDGWVSTHKDSKSLLKWLEHYKALLEYFPEYKDSIKHQISKSYATLFFNSMHNCKLTGIKYFFAGVAFDKVRFLKTAYKVFVIWSLRKLTAQNSRKTQP